MYVTASIYPCKKVISSIIKIYPYPMVEFQTQILIDDEDVGEAENGR